MENLPKFSSCRGVSFEIKGHPESPFAVPGESNDTGRWVWLPAWPRGSSLRIFPFSSEIRRSPSRPSSHFCDLEDDDENPKAIQVPTAATKDLENQKPRPRDSRLSIILLDQDLFTVYKRLFAVSLTLNLVALFLAIAGHFPYAREKAALFSMANILALTVCRNEVSLRVVFWLAVKILGRPYIPLFLKTAATSFLQSIGGVHSGCGVSSLAWLVYALVLTLQHRHEASPEIIAIASSVLSLLALSCLAAFPLVRHLHHNVFERTHRFAGWTALALLWAFVVLTAGYNPTNKTYDRFNRLAKTQELYFTIVITFLTFLPWITVRRVPVRATAESGHASLIKFPGGVKAGLLGRISRSPLSEWHAFGIISDGGEEHAMLAGAVGDFTKGLVSDPPTELWVRTVRFAGLPYLLNMYGRAVVVATGSGICVFLSFLMQPCAAEICLVWVTKGVTTNYGRAIEEVVRGQPEGRVVVHDTAVDGRPDVARMAVEAARRWRAEVVFVTSNPKGSRDVVNACKAEGIAAFAPVWDS